MRRREFISLLGGAAAARPSQRARSRANGCGVSACSCPQPQTISEFQTRVSAFLQELQQLGWAIGRNVRIAGHGQSRRHSQTRDGIGRGRARRHPGPWRLDRGGDATGDAHCADRVPGHRRSGRRRLRREPGAARRQRHWFHDCRTQHGREMAGTAQADRAKRDTGGSRSGCHHTLESASSAQPRPWRHRLGCRWKPVNVRDAGEIERTVVAFARSSNGGLIITASAPAQRHRELLTKLAARHKLPAVYSDRSFAAAGGLISYGPDRVATGKPPGTSTASSRARSRPTF